MQVASYVSIYGYGTPPPPRSCAYCARSNVCFYFMYICISAVLLFYYLYNNTGLGGLLVSVLSSVLLFFSVVRGACISCRSSGGILLGRSRCGGRRLSCPFGGVRWRGRRILDVCCRPLVASVCCRSLRLRVLCSACVACAALVLRSPADCRCLLYTSPSPRDRQKSRMPSSA